MMQLKDLFRITILTILSTNGILAENTISLCPTQLLSSGFVNDIGFLSEAVSGEESVVNNVCGEYTPLLTVHGVTVR
jgi:hypothetical protein